MIDTGARLNYISEIFVNKMNIDFVPVDYSIEVANGIDVKTTKRCRLIVSFKQIPDTEYKIDMFVISKLNKT